MEFLRYSVQIDMPKLPLAKLLMVVALALAYFAAARFGLTLATINPSATAVWPPTGIALAALLIYGNRLWPGIFIGAFAVNYVTSDSLLAASLIAAGNTLEAVVGVALANQFANGRHAFDRALDIFKFIFLVVFLSTTLSATIGVAGLLAGGLAPWDAYAGIWLTWWLGDATGALIVTPALVLWANSGFRWNGRPWEAILMVSAIVVVSFMVFDGSLVISWQNYPIQFFVFPLIVWSAFRCGTREAATANLVLAAIAVWGTIKGFGPFGNYPPQEAYLLLQGFVNGTAMTGMVLASLVDERKRAQERVREREERYRVVAETATDAIITTDIEGTITYVNAAVEKIFGYRPWEAIGRAVSLLIPDYPHFMRRVPPDANVEMHERMEVAGVRSDASLVPLEVSFSTYQDGNRHGTTGIVRDVSDRKQADEARRWLATIVESSTDAIIGTVNGTIHSWNLGATRMYGYSAAEVVGRHISVISPADRVDELPALLEQVGRGEHIADYETERVRKDGTRIKVSLTISPIVDANGVNLGASSIARDITEHKLAEERIRYLAQHDALTGLANRFLLRDRLGQAIVQARRGKSEIAILFLDLDDFKNINDSLGHEAGDHLLRVVARRLQSCLREGDTIARMGGDEFVVCLTNLASDQDAMPIAGKILASLREPFLIQGHELHIRGTIGISLFPHDGSDVESLMRAADTAMYHAKENGRDNYQFFTASLNETARRRLSIANHMHHAVKHEQFSLHYQPQVNLETGQMFAAEALLRWRHPELGQIAPGEFIRIAEETGLIVPLGEWVLRQACAQLRRWRNAGYPDLGISVNLSPYQLRRPGFADLTASILRQSDLPAAALEIELTEGTLMTQNTENVSTFGQLSDMGVRIAIDDFGTGYSSLSYLQRFPIHTLKIDRSFVDGIGSDPNDTAIINAIILMAQSLRLKVIAEGVENEYQADFLRAHGCLAAQGFYCREPMPAEQLRDLLSQPSLLIQPVH